MGKYALAWTTNRAYMPGTNAILNALEYYSFSGIDTYVLVWDDLNPQDEYFKQWPNVTFLKIDCSFWPEPKSAYWYHTFADLDFALQLFAEYDVVLLWGADVCIVNNFQEYFEYAEKLDRLILGHNEQGNQSFKAMSEEQPYGHTWDVPWADIPFFVPRSQKEVLQLTLDFQKVKGCVLDRMDGLNYAIRDLSAKVFTVPGTLWVYNVTQKLKVARGENPTSCYFMAQRMNSFHRKYWAPAFCRSYMTPHSEITRHNHLVFNYLWNFFNRNCRVKWTEGIEVWDGK